MKAFLVQVSRYGLVGIFNTAISFSVIAALTYSGIGPVLSNASGYAVGLLTSFFLNREFTFNTRHPGGALFPFFISFGICYLLNLIVLHATLSLGQFQRLLPQVLGMIAYNISFFILMRLWVFKSSERT